MDGLINRTLILSGLIRVHENFLANYTSSTLQLVQAFFLSTNGLVSRLIDDIDLQYEQLLRPGNEAISISTVL